jgi:hypothetical protein
MWRRVVLVVLVVVLGLVGLAQPLVEPELAPMEHSNTTEPIESESVKRLGLIKGLGAAGLAVEVLIAGFVPRLLKAFGGQWIGLANVRHFRTHFT